MLDALPSYLLPANTFGIISVIPVIAFIAGCFWSNHEGRRARRARMEAARSLDAREQLETLHPALIGSIALDKGYEGTNLHDIGLFDQAAASLLAMAGAGVVELAWDRRENPEPERPVRAGRRHVHEGLPRVGPMRFRYNAEPADAIDQAARRMLSPADIGAWTSLVELDATEYLSRKPFRRAQDAFERTLHAQALAHGLVCEAPLLNHILASPVIYVLEAWVIFAVMTCYNYAVGFFSFFAIMIAYAFFAGPKTRLTPLGEALKHEARAAVDRTDAYCHHRGARRVPASMERDLELLVATGAAQRSGNIVEAAAQTAVRDLGPHAPAASLARVLAWCLPAAASPSPLQARERTAAHTELPAAITELCSLGERSRAAEHDS